MFIVRVSEMQIYNITADYFEISDGVLYLYKGLSNVGSQVAAFKYWTYIASEEALSNR